MQSQGMLPLIIGITGHRDLRPEDLPRLEEMVREILRELKDSYPHTPLLILSPLGEGADRLVARVGLSEGAALCVPLPMPRDCYEAEFENDASRAEFAELLAKAQHVFTLPWLSGDCDFCEANAGSSGAILSAQYAQMGAYLTRHSQVFLALWDGDQSNELAGGTAQIVRFRLEGAPPPFGPPQSFLDPADSAPVVHIVTPRQSHPAPKGEALSRQELLPVGADNADRERAFANLDKFNADTAQNPAAQEADASINMLLPKEASGDASNTPGGVPAFLQTFGLADALSIHFQSHMARTLKRVFSAVLVAALCFNLFHSLPHAEHEKHGDGHGEQAAAHGTTSDVASHGAASHGAEESHEPKEHTATEPAASHNDHAPADHAAPDHAPTESHVASAPSAAPIQQSDIDEPLIDMGHLAGIPWFLWLYLIVVAGNVLFHHRAEKQEFQNKYQDYRALAEGLRVQIFWSMAGLNDEAADYYLGKQRSELDWIRHALRVRNVLSDAASQREAESTNDDSLLLVQRYWIQEQQRYFIRKTHRELEDLEHCEKRIQTFLMLSIGLTLALAFILAAPVLVPSLEPIKLWIEEPLTHGLVMISIVMLAVCAGLLHGYNQVKARAEHAKRYGRMAVLFDNAARHFDRLISSGQAADIPALLRELGKEALAENADWVMLHRERPLQVPHAG